MSADRPVANAVKQPLASHCALVGLVARKHVETHSPRRADWALGALIAGFLHDIGKLDPAFQAQLCAGGPPDSPFGAGPRIHEMSWALTHLAFDPAKMRRHLPSTLPWPVIQYAVYWRQHAPINSWETKRFASLSQIQRKAGEWMSCYQETLTQLLADIKALVQVELFEVEPEVRVTGEVQTPAYDRAVDLAPLAAALTEAQRTLDKSMCAAIRSALLFGDRMISTMGPGEVHDWLHAWRALQEAARSGANRPGSRRLHHDSGRSPLQSGRAANLAPPVRTRLLENIPARRSSSDRIGLM